MKHLIINIEIPVDDKQHTLHDFEAKGALLQQGIVKLSENRTDAFNEWDQALNLGIDHGVDALTKALTKLKELAK